MAVRYNKILREDERAEQLLMSDLAQLESYICSFWEFLPIPVCYVNPAFNILAVSKSFEDLFGLNAIEAIGRSLKGLFLKKEEWQAIELNLQRRIPLLNREAIIITKDRDSIPVILSAVPRKDEDGEVVGYFFSFLEIKERKKIEQDLKEKIEELEKFRVLVEGRELKMIEMKERIRDLEKRKS